MRSRLDRPDSRLMSQLFLGQAGSPREAGQSQHCRLARSEARLARYFCVCALVAAAAGSACGSQAATPPFKPVANVDQLMDATITPAAETYWGSVSTIVDKDGITENFPKTDEEWEVVWGAAMTIAESGNLLMMPSRAKDNDAWMKYSSRLVDVGLEAAKAAEAKNPELVLEKGEEVYNVCTGCHMDYIMDEEQPEAPGL